MDNLEATFDGECFVLGRIFTKDRPILLAVHDDEGDWLFFDGQPWNEKDLVLVKPEDLLERDATLADVTDLPDGWEAERAAPTAPWKRKQSED